MGTSVEHRGENFKEFFHSSLSLESSDLWAEAQTLKAAVWSNISLGHLKLKNYLETIRAVSVTPFMHTVNEHWRITEIFFQCEQVIKIDPKNVKAYFRRGTSLVEMGDSRNALSDFLKVISSSIFHSNQTNWANFASCAGTRT